MPSDRGSFAPFASNRRSSDPRRWGVAVVTVFLAAGLSSCAGSEPAPLVGGGPASTTGSTASPGAASLSSPSVTTPSVTALPALSAADTLADGFEVPWGMAALPDGSVLVSERESGEIRRVSDGEVANIGSLAGSIAAAGEGGLLGLAVGPDFANDPVVFAYLTSPTDNRVISLAYDDDGLSDPEEVLTGLPKATIHNGGRIKFGPDGFLYVGTGDASDGRLAQDPDSLAGKILRITANGDPAPGNPAEGSPVYSLGHRNVQGLAWDSAGQLWASEFGPEVDDELNLITPGGNYGWPEVTGAPGRDGFIDAQVVWPSTASSSPSGMAILDDVAYLGGLRGERLWQVPLQTGAAGTPVSHFDGEHGRLRDVIDGGDGTLWIATDEGTGSRILSVTVE